MDLKYYLSSTPPRLMQFSLWSQCGDLAPCGDLESVAGKDWAGRPQLYFLHFPLRGARGASLLRCRGGWGWGTSVGQDDWTWKSCSRHMESRCGYCWGHAFCLSYSACGLLSAPTQSPGCSGLLLWQEGSPWHLSMGSCTSPNSLHSLIV